jgi:hypothetical protein
MVNNKPISKKVAFRIGWDFCPKSCGRQWQSKKTILKIGGLTKVQRLPTEVIASTLNENLLRSDTSGS